MSKTSTEFEISAELKKKIDAAKSEGHSVYSVEIGSRTYVYRSVNRREFRELQKIMQAKSRGKDEEDSAILKEEGEDELVAKALLYPEVKSVLDLTQATGIAGAVTALAELIITASGFGVQVEPVEL